MVHNGAAAHRVKQEIWHPVSVINTSHSHYILAHTLYKVSFWNVLLPLTPFTPTQTYTSTPQPAGQVLPPQSYRSWCLVFWGCRRPLSLAGMSILEQLQFLSTCVLAFCLLRVGGQCAGNGSIVGEAVSFSSISRGRTLSLILPRARRKPFSVPRQL